MDAAELAARVQVASSTGSIEARHALLSELNFADIEAMLHGSLAQVGSAILVVSGIGASPGAACGRAYFTVDDALAGFDRGEAVVLIRTETSPADEPAMRVAEGIVTARGGLASHAAVVARGWGIPAVCGVEQLVVSNDAASCGSVRLNKGDEVSIDGTTGEVFSGSIDVEHGEGPVAELDMLLGWADEVRAGILEVWANADSGHDAYRARELGAEGIGLCRTEHQFLGARASLVARLIVDDDVSALDELFDQQVVDFVALLEAMNGLPVTVRLLDAPLHEFLGPSGPQHHDEWRETNPMLGFRGVRLGIVRPQIYATQARALASAIAERRAAGGHPHAQIMIPLIGSAAELVEAKRIVTEAWLTVLDDPPIVGAMIETPRAALIASELVPEGEFFSFGTNDLTQLAFGFSRDDLEAKVIAPYLDAGLLAVSPFATIDREGVGELMRLAAATLRRLQPGANLGICGEHAGDPDSIAFFVELGLNYVSCSPFRVEVARLAAAQAILRGRSGAGVEVSV
ncbi:MAG: putative PEP-binding protein [Acidimicrobiales bacterium]